MAEANANDQAIATICDKFIEECSDTPVQGVQLVAAVSRVIGLVLSRFPAPLRERAFQAFVSGARAEMESACAAADLQIH